MNVLAKQRFEMLWKEKQKRLARSDKSGTDPTDWSPICYLVGPLVRGSNSCGSELCLDIDLYLNSNSWDTRYAELNKTVKQPSAKTKKYVGHFHDSFQSLTDPQSVIDSGQRIYYLCTIRC